jgi:hypothetical protein
MTGPIVLLDQPDDYLCEERGWVSTDATEDEARDLLIASCYAEDGRTNARPVGTPKRVWLKPDDKPDEDERWHRCEAADEGALEFYEFDAQDVEPVPAMNQDDAP